MPSSTSCNPHDISLDGKGASPLLRLDKAEAFRLMQDILNRDLRVNVRVTGKSMAPSIHDGDGVILKRLAPGEAHPGDIVLFRATENGYLLHRLVRIGTKKDGSRTFQTKGDALLAPDQAVSEENVLAKALVITRKRPDGSTTRINLESPIAHTKSRLIVLRGLTYWALRRILSTTKKTIFYRFKPKA